MPRYLIERDFPSGLTLPSNEDGAQVCNTVIGANAKHQVTWVHSYVSPDRTKTFCIYDGPTQDAVRAAAKDTQLPITKITEVRVLNPYFHH